MQTTYSSPDSDVILGYKETNGRPYLVDFLDTRFVLGEGDKENYDLVDEWINLEMNRLHLKATKDSYADIFNGLVKKLDVHKHAEPSEKVRKAAVILREAVEKNRLYKKMGIDLQSLDEIYG